MSRLAHPGSGLVPAPLAPAHTPWRECCIPGSSRDLISGTEWNQNTRSRLPHVLRWTKLAKSFSLSLSLCLSEGQTPPSLPFGPIRLDSRGPLTVTEDEAFHRRFEAPCIPSPFTMARAPLQPPSGTRYKGWGRCLHPSTRQLPRTPSTPGLLENHFRSYKMMRSAVGSLWSPPVSIFSTKSWRVVRPRGSPALMA